MKLYMIFPVLAAAAMYGQNAQLSGLISDASKAVVPNAAVVVSNTQTGLKRTVQSNRDGYYTVSLLHPGTYLITVRATGFQTVARDKVELEVEQDARVDFTLEVGRSEQTITVSGEAPLLNTESAVVGTVVNRQFVENMPLNGRSFQSLITLTPGVVVANSNSSSVGQFSINGQRPDANYFMIDGVSANAGVGVNGQLNSQGGGSGVQVATTGGYNNQVSIDAMQEFKIETSTFAPEYGRFPGGQISIVTRSGTNAFHGAGFDYLRNTVLDANNWFNDANRVNRPPERQNDFGGVLGGPVLKNKLFFFFSYEGLRLLTPQTVIGEIVPSTLARQTAIPSLQPFLNSFPLPNSPCPACDVNTSAFNGGYSNQNTLNATSLRMDWAPSSKLTIMGRANYAPSVGKTRNASSTANLNENTSGLKQFTLGLTYLATPSITNEIRFNTSYFTSYTSGFLDNFGGAVPAPDSVLFPAPYTANNAQLNWVGRLIGGLLVGDLARDHGNQYQYIDTLSWVHGAHQMKFGFDYRRLHPVGFRYSIGQTIVFGLTTDSFITGTPSSVGTSAFSPKDFLVNNVGMFAEDTWKLTHRLTLTYGLRWDVNPAPHGPNKTASPVALTKIDYNNLASINVAPIGTELYATEWKAFAPRIGIAYHLSQNPNWGRVIRGGFGVFFDTAGAANGFAERPFTSGTIFPTPTYPIPAGVLVPPGIPIVPPFGFVTTIDPSLRLPYTLQTNVALEQSLGANQVFTITYAAAFGREMLRKAEFGSPNALFPQGFYTVGNDGTSSYNSLQLLFQRRFSRGFQAMASYVWSHSIDEGGNGNTQTPNKGVESVTDYKGPSDWDIRHSFQSALSYNIPSPSQNVFVKALLGHWGTDWIFRARSAPPIDLSDNTAYYGPLNPFIVGPTGTLIGNPNGFGYNIRPDTIAGVPYWISDPHAPGGKRLNPAAFIVYPPRTALPRQGFLGRNAVSGFGWNQLDLTLRREFPVYERMKLQFRADFFNILNHPSFGFNNTSPLDVSNPLFGVSNATLNNSLGPGGNNGGFNSLYQIGGPRSIQLSAKIVF